MSVTEAFSKICNLDSIEFYSGEYYTIEFSVYNEIGLPVDLLSMLSVGASIGYYGSYDELAYKTGDIDAVDTYKFTIEISPTDTTGISGKFVYQPKIVDNTNKVFKLGQGIITVLPTPS